MQHINMAVYRGIHVYVRCTLVLFTFCPRLVPLSRSLTAHRSITTGPGHDKRLHLCIVFFSENSTDTVPRLFQLRNSFCDDVKVRHWLSTLRRWSVSTLALWSKLVYNNKNYKTFPIIPEINRNPSTCNNYSYQISVFRTVAFRGLQPCPNFPVRCKALTVILSEMSSLRIVHPSKATVGRLLGRLRRSRGTEWTVIKVQWTNTILNTADIHLLSHHLTAATQ